LLIQDIGLFDEFKHRWLSVGIHPWYAHNDWEQQLARMALHIAHKNVIAIGECGLDRLIPMPLSQQLVIFEAQVQLAQAYQKPVIIHCVKAFNELLHWKKQSKVNVPLIIHGFNNHPQIAQQLLEAGFYLSLGTAVLNPRSNAAKVASLIPAQQFFLENDNQDTPVQSVYEAAANLLNLPIDVLENQIWHNFAAITSVG